MRMSRITNANDSDQSAVSVFQHEREFVRSTAPKESLTYLKSFERFCYMLVVLPRRDLSGG